LSGFDGSHVSASVLEKLLGDDTGLWQAIHPFLYFTVDIAIGGGFVPEVVVLDDVVLHVCNAQSHVFVPGHRGVYTIKDLSVVVGVGVGVYHK
jgi:hypothetical protein